jgi:hypothetical protein
MFGRKRRHRDELAALIDEQVWLPPQRWLPEDPNVEPLAPVHGSAWAAAPVAGPGPVPPPEQGTAVGTWQPASSAPVYGPAATPTDGSGGVPQTPATPGVAPDVAAWVSAALEPGPAAPAAAPPPASPPPAAALLPAAPPVAVPEIEFTPFRNGFPHVEIATTDGECLVLDPSHPLFPDFRRWGSEWAIVGSHQRVFRVHPDAIRLPGVGTPPRGRVRSRT